jgi:alpha-galactosidase
MIGVFNYEEREAFVLSTGKTTYAFGVSPEGLLTHFYYGARLEVPEGEYLPFFFASLTEKAANGKGTTVSYKKDSEFVAEDALFEVSGTGKGDFREPMIALEYADGSRTNDFIYKSHEILDTKSEISGLPSALPSGGKELKITLCEREKAAELDIYFNVYEDCDVITRRCVLKNTGNDDIRIIRLLSNQVDFDSADFDLTSFGGNWGREMGKKVTPVRQGTVCIASRCGVSSNRANPFVMLSKEGATEKSGDVFGFNLVYSGDHYESASVSGFNKTRFLQGINPESFEKKIKGGESFEAPESVMSYSAEGFSGLSKSMHAFVRKYIVRGKYKDEPRPILLNSWEAAYFNINEASLLRLAKKAADAGVELFVMDDGWFKGRNDDKTSLGDWTVDTKKLPGGVARLAEKVNDLGLKFGIWVEPEMISEDSDLYRAHPEYAMTVPGRENSPGRNQMLLDLANPEVCEYVKNAMRDVFGTPGVSYVKWDMNRMFADIYCKALPADEQGDVLHRYYLGLYDILKTLMSEFPDILFEGCASGGNRFDLGMLCYFTQIWGSDDTDAIERTKIQKGYSYGYPMSTVTAHVSACPNHQTLRNTPFETRFNIAAFGVLGYELNLCEVSNEEFEEVKKQIEIYKKWREVFFKGEFYRVNDKEWMVVSPDKTKAVAMIWNELCEPNTFYLRLQLAGLDPDKYYHVYNERMKHNIKLFGDLVNQVAPIHVKKDSLLHNTIAKFVKMDGEVEDYILSGRNLMAAGIKLSQGFGGTGYNDKTRLFQDFASRMYFIEAVDPASLQ